MPVGVARQIQIMMQRCTEISDQHCPTSWDKVLPGKFASGQLVSLHPSGPVKTGLAESF